MSVYHEICSMHRFVHFQGGTAPRRNTVRAVGAIRIHTMLITEASVNGRRSYNVPCRVSSDPHEGRNDLDTVLRDTWRNGHVGGDAEYPYQVQEDPVKLYSNLK